MLHEYVAGWDSICSDVPLRVTGWGRLGLALCVRLHVDLLPEAWHGMGTEALLSGATSIGQDGLKAG